MLLRRLVLATVGTMLAASCAASDPTAAWSKAEICKIRYTDKGINRLAMEMTVSNNGGGCGRTTRNPNRFLSNRAVFEQPAHGSVETALIPGNFSGDHYVPQPGYEGADHFVVISSDVQYTYSVKVVSIGASSP